MNATDAVIFNLFKLHFSNLPLDLKWILIILVVILTRFAGGIEYGGDKAQFMYELGKGLPLSILVFTISMVVSRTLFAPIV